MTARAGVRVAGPRGVRVNLIFGQHPYAAGHAISIEEIRDCIGKTFSGEEPTFVRPEHAKLFAKATGDLNPAYEGEGAGGKSAAILLCAAPLRTATA